MATTLVGVGVAGENKDYGSTFDDEDLVVPFRQPPSRRRPSSWKTKKVVFGIIGVMLAVVGSGAKVLSVGPESVLLRFYPYVTITNKTPHTGVSPIRG